MKAHASGDMFPADYDYKDVPSSGLPNYMGPLPLLNIDFDAMRAERARIAAIPDEPFIRSNLTMLATSNIEDLTTADRARLEAEALDAAHQLAATVRYGDDGYNHFGLVDALYRAWFVGQQDVYGTENSGMLNSFESFSAAFGLDSNARAIGALMRKMSLYKSFVLGNRTITAYHHDADESKSDFGGYNLVGEWLKIHDSGGSRTYVDRSIVDEVRGLGENWKNPGALVFHETGSAALAGIGAAGAILSGARAIRRGHIPRTGEFIEYPEFSGPHCSVKERASGTVWVAFGMSGSYSTARWFDEYPIAFGISQERLVEHRNRQGIVVPGLYETGEGIMAGPEIPLELVEIVYAPKQDVIQAREWVDANCPPDTPVVSLEAAQHYGTIIDKMSDLERQCPVVIE